MKIQFTDDYGTYTVERPLLGCTLSEVMDELVTPVLLAAGFQQGSIDACLNPEKYPNDTAEISVDLTEDLIEQVDQMARLCGLDRNDTMKAILGFELYRQGAVLPK